MLVVDTNVLVYLLIQGDNTRLAQDLYSRDPEWRSESFLLVEFSNVLVTYLRTGALSLAQTNALMIQAEQSVRGLVSVPHSNALKIAGAFSVSAYDARFLAVARQLGGKLVTEDLKLRSAAPALTQSLKQALAD